MLVSNFSLRLTSKKKGRTEQMTSGRRKTEFEAENALRALTFGIMHTGPQRLDQVGFG